jgi:hypothetical protein
MIQEQQNGFQDCSHSDRASGRSGEGAMKLIKFRKGQMAIVMTLAMATLLGVMALGTDVGVMYYQWNQLQKGADAAALAGANYLNGGITPVGTIDGGCASRYPSTPSDDPKRAACTYAVNNGLASDASSLTINQPGLNLPPGAPTPNLQVIVTRSGIPYTFGRVIGLDTYKVAAFAAAKSTLPTNSARGLFPLGMQCTSPCNMSKLVPGQSVPFNQKFTPVIGGAPGNWQWWAVGNGASDLATVVSNGMPGTFTIGQSISTDTGNKGNSGPVSTAFDGRMASCAKLGSDPCNGGATNNIPAGDPCLVTIPAVDFAGCNGNCSVTIEGFAQVYIEPTSSSKNKGKSGSQITACFITGVDGNTVTGSSSAPSLGAIEPPKLIQ